MRLSHSARLAMFLLFTLLSAFMPAAVSALTPQEVFELVKDSVLVVKVYDAQGKQLGQGSGVMLPSGEIVTNYHVLKAGSRYEVGSGKEFKPAAWTSGNEDKDLGLLKAEGVAAKPARVGQAGNLKVGEPVYAIGSPQGLELSISDGIVSQLRGTTPPIIQTTAAISPGSSGGGLFNAEGNLVGITTFFLEEGQSLNFAVPVEWLGTITAGKKEGTKEKPAVDWLARAAYLEGKKDWEGMLEWTRQWTRAEPGEASAWGCLGVAYYWMNRLAEAIEAYREAVRLKPDFSLAWFSLVVAYAASGNKEEALKAVRELRQYDPAIADMLFDQLVPK